MRVSSGVYEILNLVNGKRYVGSSINLKSRRWRHFSNLRNGRHENEHLQRSWDRYGGDSFVFRVVLECDKDELLEKEQELIDSYEFSSLYNILKFAYSARGYEISSEARRKISESKMGHEVSAETRKKLSKAHAGKTVSESTRAKISTAMVGNQHLLGYEPSTETRLRLSEAGKGRITSDETKQRQSEAAKGRKVSDETRKKNHEAAKSNWGNEEYRKRQTERVMSDYVKQKLADANTGRVISVEAREKMSIARRGKPGRKNSEETKKKISSGLKEYWSEKRRSGFTNTTETGETSNGSL